MGSLGFPLRAMHVGATVRISVPLTMWCALGMACLSGARRSRLHLMYGGVQPAAGVSIFTPGDSAGMNYSPGAFRYLSEAFGPEIDHRLGPQRRETFRLRLNALAMLYQYIESEPEQRVRRLSDWNRVHSAVLTARKWSPAQHEAMDTIRRGIRLTPIRCLKRIVGSIYLVSQIRVSPR